MLSFVKFSFVLLTIGLSASGCKTVVGSGTLPATRTEQIEPPAIEQHQVISNQSDLKIEDLKKWNAAAGKPSFGVIPAYYQLPVSMPAGAVRIESAVVFGAAYSSFQLSNAGPKPYAVEPLSIPEAQAVQQVVNQFLDAGVRLSEVSMADANRVMLAEKEIIERKSQWLPGMQAASGVDFLISIQRGQGLYGSAFVGRVIRTKDGQLLALANQVDAGAYSLEPLLRQLVSDALRRLADGA